MDTFRIPESWLEQFNARMGEQGTPHISRPFLALMEWSREHQCQIDMFAPTEDYVFQWFYAHSPSGAHLPADMYNGPFYFDGAFWHMRVPLMYGRGFEVDLLDFITMPQPVKDALLRHGSSARQFQGVWADAYDYSYGLQETEASGEIRPFLPAAQQQLSAAAKLLLWVSPEQRAIEASRLAVEMFLKAYLCLHCGKSEDEAAKFRHRLGDALTEILACNSSCELAAISGRLGSFPEVGERYAGARYSVADLWDAYRTALYAGASVARSISRRNTRAQLGVVFQ